jgi:hypothetical protein
MDIELRYKIDLAIELLAEHSGLLEYNKILNLFKENGINRLLVDEIYIFLPIVFCKKLLPNVNFPKTYYEQDISGKREKKFFDASELYKLIELCSEDYFKNNPESETILKIASLSAEFNAINNLLMDGGELEDVKLTETVILK